MIEQTRSQLQTMKLIGLLNAFDEQLRAPLHQLSFEERLSLLIDSEFQSRENKRLTSRLKCAKLKPAAIEHIDFKTSRGLKKNQCLSLLNLQWVKQSRTVIITGPTGTGKTYLSCALAHKACLEGYTARYYRLLPLMHDLTMAYHDNKLPRLLTTVSKIQVLILDDFGLMTLDDLQKRLLLELLEQRYETTSTIITSQLPIASWYEYLNDPLLADALLDRIVHQAEKINLQGESFRKIKQVSNENES
jgi:DNA replication protein DnaC